MKDLKRINSMRFDFYTPTEIANILGERLKQQRLLLNLTQADLANKAGIGLSTVARIETGDGGTLDNMIRLAIGLGLINEFATLFELKANSIDDIIEQQNLRKRASKPKSDN